MPLDINGNGRLEPEEDFYADRDSLIVAIKDGRYPAPPARTLYVACKGKPQNPVVNAFLRWILEKGQAFTAETGYIALSTEEINQQLGKMTDTPK
jgi:phosphate transport system substrate-binding protein